MTHALECKKGIQLLLLIVYHFTFFYLRISITLHRSED